MGSPIRWSMGAGGSKFERDLVHAFETFFMGNSIAAMAYRRKQSRFQPQEFDVVIDSATRKWYSAIECKSVLGDRAKCIYFTSNFNITADGHQLDREAIWLRKTGRRGYLAIEVRKKGGNTAAIVPFSAVYAAFQAEKIGIRLEEVWEYPLLPRKGGKYFITDRVFDAV